MPDQPKDPPVVERFVLADTEAEKRKQFEIEMRYLEDHPLDKCKRPGGYYINANGSGAHDSEGRPVPLLPEDEPLAASRREAVARLQSAAAPPAGESPEELSPATGPDPIGG